MYKTKTVVLAIKALGGESSLEHIAVKCAEIDPKQFKFKHYDHPNAHTVRRALSQAVLSKYIDRVGKGEWKITDIGLTHVGDTKVEQVSTSLGVFDPKKFSIKVRNSALYRDFVEIGSVSDWDKFCFVIDCSPDMDEEAIAIKYKRFREKIDAMKDMDGVENLVKFAELCGNVLRERESNE